MLGSYLADLGVSHAYLSPILGAGKGSTHGYDVVDHRHIDTQLGGAAGYTALRQALREHGIGVVVDVVPNHMAIPVPEHLNQPLWSVLREGRDSPFAAWFDIDWDAEGGRMVMPVLDGPLAENLSNLKVVKRGGKPELRYFDHRFPIADGTSSGDLRIMLDAQHYRLTDWRDAATQLNYRRFCDITTLIGLRVEMPEVFEASHAVLIDLVARGELDGLRIDHPDGLADPAGYLGDLAAATDATWVVVEKVLAYRESLPADWQAAGTTGYETLTVLNGLIVDPSGEAPLSQLYTELTGDSAHFTVAAEAGKRLIMTDVLVAELNRLARLLAVRVDGELETSADGHQRARDALVEVLAGLHVYRPFTSSPRTIAALDEATLHAMQTHPQLRAEIDVTRAHALEPGEFGTRFGQTAAAVYAKGVEDTAFYRFSRLLSLNEVGGDPGTFGFSLNEFHRHASMLQTHTPTAMTTLSTHDTKRGEDVRARLAVLSELPGPWEPAIRDWLRRGAAHGCPDERTGYFFWQTLVGAWPLNVDRATRYMEKATREAKLTTSWQTPNAIYDDAVRGFVTAVFEDEALLAEVAEFVATLEPYAHANSLGQKLVQLTMPGVPDVYQGCELPNFALVDPDNRGAVDFDVRRAALPNLLDEKVRVTANALRLRRNHPDWFGSYEPVVASGAAADHLVGFMRSSSVVVLATRFSAHLKRDGGWRDTSVTLPDVSWIDAISGVEHDGGDMLVEHLLNAYPVALLVPAVSVTDRLK